MTSQIRIEPSKSYIIKMILLLIILPLFFSCELYLFKEVEYRVECTATPNLVDITIKNEKDKYSGFIDISPPWAHPRGAYVGDHVYISAENLQDHGNVTVTIYVNGELFGTNTAIGAYGIATSAGFLELEND